MTGVCLFVCVVGPGFDSTSPAFVRSSQPGGRERRSACQKTESGPPSLGAGIVYPQFVQMYAAFQPRAGCTFLELSGTIIKFIENYIKGRKAYTTDRNHTSSQHQFKTGVPQGDVLSLTLFNIYTADIPPPRAPIQVMAYADIITITSTNTSTSAAKKYLQPYLHKVFAWTNKTISH